MIWPLLLVARSAGAVITSVSARGSLAGTDAEPIEGLQLFGAHTVPLALPWSVQPAMMIRQAIPLITGGMFPAAVPVQSTGTIGFAAVRVRSEEHTSALQSRLH